VTLVLVALLRGAIFGAAAGFGAGLLYDMGTFGTLGFIALLYTLVGYWIGRYGETTGRDRSHAPLLSVAVVTVLFAFGALMLHFFLGENAPARAVLVESLFPTTLLNLLLTIPGYAGVRRILRPAGWADRAREVRLLG
jgi:rod shape-determining protein MreD